MTVTLAALTLPADDSWGRTVPELRKAVSWKPEGGAQVFGFVDRLQEWHGKLFSKGLQDE